MYLSWLWRLVPLTFVCEPTPRFVLRLRGGESQRRGTPHPRLANENTTRPGWAGMTMDGAWPRFWLAAGWSMCCSRAQH